MRVNTSEIGVGIVYDEQPSSESKAVTGKEFPDPNARTNVLGEGELITSSLLDS